MKRTQSEEQHWNKRVKPRTNRPFNITVGSSSTTQGEEEKLLGSKTKGAVYLRDKKTEKKKFDHYNYGNYHSYYTTRRKQGSSLVDPRIDLLDGSIFDGKSVLDIGCNSGNITISLAKKYKLQHIKGVDIDDTLINKANTNLRIAYSLNNPNSNEGDISPIDLSLRFHYFPQAMSNMFGLMPTSVPPGFHSTKFPWNVEFEVLDWTEHPYDESEAQYDTIMALSITKWIQLHGGDKGLKSFFKKAYDSLLPGGIFVLEPQEFETFQRRAKQIDASKKVKEELKFRPEDYEDFLINQLGFIERRDLGIPKGEIKGFSRPIMLYIK